MITVDHKFDAVSGILRFTADVHPNFEAQDEIYKKLLSGKYRADVSIIHNGSSGTLIVDVIPVGAAPELKPPIVEPPKPDLKPPDKPKPPDIIKPPEPPKLDLRPRTIIKK